MNEQQLLDNVVSWIESKAPFEGEIEVDTNLIEGGYLSSLMMMEFILFIEDCCGKPVKLNKEAQFNLSSVSRIFNHYC
jgi:acyl carrier protein